MANTPSAIKRARQTVAKTENNRAKVSNMRTAVKKVHTAVETGEGDIQELLRAAFKAIDSAATKGLIHQNKADRDKSRLNQFVNQAQEA